MADWEAHKYLAIRKFGQNCIEVHKFMDQYGALGPFHRHKLHHWEGIEECARYLARTTTNNDIGFWRAAAKHHVEVDYEYCGHQYPIPYKVDYLGGDGSWPTGDKWTVGGIRGLKD